MTSTKGTDDIWTWQLVLGLDLVFFSFEVMSCNWADALNAKSNGKALQSEMPRLPTAEFLPDDEVATSEATSIRHCNY